LSKARELARHATGRSGEKVRRAHWRAAPVCTGQFLREHSAARDRTAGPEIIGALAPGERLSAIRERDETSGAFL
jgi:hypothetical protein